jgi:UDP-N-acetylglucosamine 2-epimerase (non-hydrolysing)
MKVILVAGARPNFMKIAPLMHAINRHNLERTTLNIEPIVVHTGQHYDYEMSTVFFEDLELPEPGIYLGVGSGTHAEQVGGVMIEFEKVLFKEKPDLVIVVGDVNSTLAAALAAVKLHIPVSHVEAGLYFYDLSIPEEVNRLLTDQVSDWLFTPCRDADENLRKVGIPEDRIFFVGNIMVDSLLLTREKAAQRQTLGQLGLKNEGYALLTLHRPDNVDNEPTLKRLMQAISEVSKRIPVVFPVHPRTQKRIKEFNVLNRLPVTSHQLFLTEPLGYLDFLNLEMNAKFVMTDSGGIQAETTILNIPCLTLYQATLWTVTLTQGTNALVGTEPEKIIEEAFKILDRKIANHQSLITDHPSYPELWDGKTAERIVKIISRGLE